MHNSPPMTGNHGPAQVVTSEETFKRPRLASAGGDKHTDTTQRHCTWCFSHVFLSLIMSNPHLSSIVDGDWTVIRVIMSPVLSAVSNRATSGTLMKL